MKKVILIGDGMGDYPVEALGGRTPLQAADMPAIRRLAAQSACHWIQPVPESMHPGSDVANLSLLGYNPAENYTGRAPIEAAGQGLPLAEDDVAYRCNLVTVTDGVMRDYSAGHISNEEAAELIRTCREHLQSDAVHFHEGVSYRHLVVWKNGPEEVVMEPPHEISDKDIEPYLPKGARADEIRALMDASRDLFADHPVNRQRIEQGKNPATQIWPWGHGKAMSLPSYRELYGLEGGVISAVDLVRGLGRLAGLEPVRVPGATGFLDTNYRGKVDAALQVLKDRDFVYVHIEAPDECGHLGDAEKKKFAIEEFSRRVVEPVWQGLEERGEPYRVIVTMDHRTPVSTRGHTSEPVPLLVCEGPTGPLDKEAPFDESIGDGMKPVMAYDFIQAFLKT